MTDNVHDQIISIRYEGKYNMFDVVSVQREAYEQGFNELVYSYRNIKMNMYSLS